MYHSNWTLCIGEIHVPIIGHLHYSDDLLILNNPTFEEAIRDIYLPQLELKRTMETDSRLSYLDVELTIIWFTFSI